MICGVSLWIRFDDDFQARLSDSIQDGANVSLQLDSVPSALLPYRLPSLRTLWLQMYLVLYGTAAIGGLLCLCGFLGCCGACCESVCLLGLVSSFLPLLSSLSYPHRLPLTHSSSRSSWPCSSWRSRAPSTSTSRRTTYGLR